MRHFVWEEEYVSADRLEEVLNKIGMLGGTVVSVCVINRVEYDKFFVTMFIIP